eukprot:scaffold21114_cov69-Isochrysis_galbana.AAC.1
MDRRCVPERGRSAAGQTIGVRGGGMRDVQGGGGVDRWRRMHHAGRQARTPDWGRGSLHDPRSTSRARDTGGGGGSRDAGGGGGARDSGGGGGARDTGEGGRVPLSPHLRFGGSTGDGSTARMKLQARPARATAPVVAILISPALVTVLV